MHRDEDVGRSENPGEGQAVFGEHILLPPICKTMGGQSTPHPTPPLVPTTIPWQGAEYICPRAFNVRINFYGARTKKKITEGFLLMTWGPRLPDSSGQKALDALCESQNHFNKILRWALFMQQSLGFGLVWFGFGTNGQLRVHEILVIFITILSRVSKIDKNDVVN